eukprot:Pompholyxophrys_punicea_v1_NODE_317_length_2277_cov_3.387663.p1 type:complete len:197 gc:universal NODE_317_length_2277_cov_3.387663:2010-1420(-)
MAIREDRARPSSKYSLRHMSPNHQREKYQNLMKERRSLRVKLQKYEKLEVKLEPEQSDELREFHDILESIFAEADSNGTFAGKGGILHSIWREDVNRNVLSQDFWNDQAKNFDGKGVAGTTWSVATYKICLSIFLRSTAAYEALKSFNILSLPCTKSLQNIVRSHFVEQGVQESIFFLNKERFMNSKKKGSHEYKS